jgi:hypothetical protein
MDPKKIFIDDRLKGICSYCGAEHASRDHTPSRVFLDQPYPEDLAVSESCIKCNTGFSADEEYVACLIECVIQGTTKPTPKFRDKVARTLTARPSIAARIEKGKQSEINETILWQPEMDRVHRVIVKLAQGHVSYELGLPHIGTPDTVEIIPIPCMSEEQFKAFNNLDYDSPALYPEIGSRAFISIVCGKPTAYNNWNIVQDGRYRYAVGQSSGDWVKLVLSEYLACLVVWNQP